MKKAFRTSGFVLSVGIVAAVTACSKSFAPSGVTPQSMPAPQLKSGILPAEKSALAALTRTLHTTSDVSPDDQTRTLLSSFQFTSDDALKAIEKIILEEAKNISDLRADEDSSEAKQCLFVSNLFWNRVAASEFALNPTQARAALRPWLEDLLVSGSKKFSSRAQLALTLYPERVLPGDDEKALVEISRRFPVACTLAGVFSDENSHPLQKRLEARLAVQKAAILAKGVPGKTALDRIQNQAQLLSQVAIWPEAQRVSLYEKLIFESKLPALPTATPLTQVNEAVPAMSWQFNGHGELGRCLSDSPSVNGTALSSFESGKRCSLNGGPEGIYNLGISALETTQCTPTDVPGATDFVGGSSTCFHAHLFSYARGGHRNSKFPIEGDEDETTHIHYDAIGNATIPACDNPAVCDPILILTYKQKTSDDNGHPLPAAGASDLVELEAPSLGGIVRMVAGEPMIADRSFGPIHVRIHLSRGFTHIGASGEPPLMNQVLTLTLQNKSTHPGVAAQSEDLMIRSLFDQAASALESPQTSSSAAPSTDGILGFVSQLSRGLNGTPSLFENHLSRDYGRLFLIQAVLDEKILPVTATERRELLLAKQTISDEARKLHLSTLQFLYNDRKQLLSLIPLSSLSREIARLMSLANDAGLELDPALSAVQPLLSALSAQKADPAITALLADYQQVNTHQTKLLDAIAGLYKIRLDLDSLREKLETETLLYAKEILDLTGQDITASGTGSEIKS